MEVIPYLKYYFYLKAILYKIKNELRPITCKTLRGIQNSLKQNSWPHVEEIKALMKKI